MGREQILTGGRRTRRPEPRGESGEICVRVVFYPTDTCYMEKCFEFLAGKAGGFTKRGKRSEERPVGNEGESDRSAVKN